MSVKEKGKVMKFYSIFFEQGESWVVFDEPLEFHYCTYEAAKNTLYSELEMTANENDDVTTGYILELDTEKHSVCLVGQLDYITIPHYDFTDLRA